MKHSLVRKFTVVATVAVVSLVVCVPAMGDTFAVKNKKDSGPGTANGHTAGQSRTGTGRDLVRPRGEG